MNLQKMLRSLLILLCIGLSFTQHVDNKQEWAVLVAGSSGFGNYRHQADICHAYHILRNHGIPESNIILMMFDDIAHNPMNPYPGKLFNQPNGTDVYEGVKIDYKGEDVTPGNFLKVLQGQDMSGIGTGRTLHSGPKDHIFVYFTDHGAPGLIAFPDSILHAQDLNNALKNMHKKHQYARLVFYLEACESGSMFDKILPKNIDVYAMTAANTHESSWGCYCDNTMHLPCLGDLFSVIWMQDSDAEDLRTETLGQQFQIVKKGTDKSHVMEYGDLSWQNEHVSDYQGENPVRHMVGDNVPITGKVPAPEIPLYQLRKRLREATTLSEKRHVHHLINHRMEGVRYIDHLFAKVVNDLTMNLEQLESVMTSDNDGIYDFRCHKILTEAFHQRCLSLTTHTYALKHVYMLNNLCKLDMDLAQLVITMINTCESHARTPRYAVE